MKTKEDWQKIEILDEFVATHSAPMISLHGVLFEGRANNRSKPPYVAGLKQAKASFPPGL